MKTSAAAVHGAKLWLRSLFSPSSVPLWVIAAVLATFAIGFVSLGGLAPAVRTPAAAALGDDVRTSLYAVTVLGAELTDEVEDQYLKAEPGEDLLVMTMTLENLTTRPIGVLDSADGINSRLLGARESLLDLDGVEPTGIVSVWHTGSSASPVLQPGVPAEVKVAWPVPEKSFPSGEAMLDVYDVRERGGYTLISARDVTWKRTVQAARIWVEVTR